MKGPFLFTATLNVSLHILPAFYQRSYADGKSNDHQKIIRELKRYVSFLIMKILFYIYDHSVTITGGG